MKKKIVLSIVCLVLVAVGTFALVGSNKSDFVISPDGRFVTATHPPVHITPTPAEDANLKVIFSNLSTYRKATYFSLLGYTIAQNTANFPFQSWFAIAFTPTANATVTKLEVAAGKFSGTTGTGFEIGLYDDNAGLPGKVIKRFHVAHPITMGQCCLVQAVTDSAGIPVTAGTQYWVALTTTAKDLDLYTWDFNTTNMDSNPAAEWCGNNTTICGANNDKWRFGALVQTAMAVLGH
jgi:hypothetical protein